MTIILVAGPLLSASALHCAGVSAGWGIAEADKTNAAHWRAAGEGKQGYRLSGRDLRLPDDALHLAESVGAGAARVTTAVARPDLDVELPSDLSIPPFLKRAPQASSPAPFSPSEFPAVTTAAAERADTVPGADPHSPGRGV
jgi:hypothetical protein